MLGTMNCSVISWEFPRDLLSKVLIASGNVDSNIIAPFMEQSGARVWVDYLNNSLKPNRYTFK